MGLCEQEAAGESLPMNGLSMGNEKIHGSRKNQLGGAKALRSPLDGRGWRGRSGAALCTAIGSLTLNAFLIIVLVIISTTSSAPGTTPAPVAPPPTARLGCCPDGWVGFRSKCYHFVEAEKNWTSSETDCSSLNASLTAVDSREEMDFLRRYKTSADYWIGLQRDHETDPWRWINGTNFGLQFQVGGLGECAYVNQRGIASSSCAIEQAWICSQPASR